MSERDLFHVERDAADPHRARLKPIAEPGPLAGKTDPETSHEAARKLIDSCQLADAQRAALALVRQHPGRTCVDLAQVACAGDERGIEFHRQRIGRRLSELERAGLIEHQGHATDPRTGRRAVRWWPVEGVERR